MPDCSGSICRQFQGTGSERMQAGNGTDSLPGANHVWGIQGHEDCGAGKSGEIQNWGSS